MQTYKPIVIETGVAATLSLAVAGLLAPGDLGLSTLYPHPIWLAVLVVSARYGSRGLSVCLPLSWAALILACLAVRISPAEVLARTASGSDLGALIGVVLVAAVASIHERRHEVTQSTLDTLKVRCAADRAAVKELREAAVVLRTRADRLETSLTFLREIATRLEGNDAMAAAHAALELAVARTGARAGTAQVVLRDGSCKAVAAVGTWAPDAPVADLSRDQTVLTALRNGRPTRAFDLSEVSAADSDLAAPILDARGQVAGVLALRGVRHGGANAVALHDLALVAAWCAKGFAGAVEHLRIDYVEMVVERAEVPIIPTRPAGPSNVIELIADLPEDFADDYSEALTEPPPRTISQINA